MIKQISLVFILFFSLFGILFTSADAAGCTASPYAYRSGSSVIATATFKCSSVTGRGQVCMSGSCSPVVSIPSNGTSSSTFTRAGGGYGICIYDTYLNANAYINGVLKATYRYYPCR